MEGAGTSLHSLPRRLLSWLPVMALLVMTLAACNKKSDDSFDIRRVWRVERETVQGVEVPNSAVVGTRYDFTDKDKCVVTAPDGTRNKYVWSYDKDSNSLLVGVELYTVYTAERNEFVFGKLQGNVDGGTYTLTPSR